ncbi:hypothetical protein P0C22_16215 [Plesiomonas shigelloides]|uniref:hypothetical protein n=1 Tax=Plesiomonas shigelloides TaxID=703 RepID=UPI0030C17467
MNITILVISKESVFEAIAYDSNGLEVDRITGLTEASARRLLKLKLGLPVKKKKNKRTPSKATLFDTGSVMSGLRGITSSKNWKKVK